MHRLVNTPSRRKMVNFKETPKSDGKLTSNSIPSPPGESRNSLASSCFSEVTFGSVLCHPCTESSDKVPNSLSTTPESCVKMLSRTIASPYNADTVSSGTSTPTGCFHLTSPEESLPFSKLTNVPPGLSCGHSGSTTFTCEVCYQKKCSDTCKSLNTCTHSTCKSCCVHCSCCDKLICIKCMHRCVECLNKLCSAFCGTRCLRCSSLICAKCATNKGISDRQDACLCLPCVHGLIGASATKEKEWRIIFTEEHKLSLIRYKDGRCFTVEGMYIGRLM